MRAFLFFLAALFCSAAFVHAELNKVQKSPTEVLQVVSFEQKLGGSVPKGVMFRDESGTSIPLSEIFRGKPVILTLVYFECPMLCTQVLNGLLKSMEYLNLKLDKDFDILTVSFDPEDTPDLARSKRDNYLSAYNKKNNAQASAQSWRFLTGDADAIKALTESVGFRYTQDAATGDFAHESGIVVLTPEGKISRYFYGVEYNPRDVRLALVDSSSGEIGTLADHVILLCYAYDPITGKYGLAGWNLIRILGFLMTAAFAVYIFRTVQSSRKKTEEQNKESEE